MDYLLSPIRRELEQRYGGEQAPFSTPLVIDFDNGDIQLKDSNDIHRVSVLEMQNRDSRILSGIPDHSVDIVVVNLQTSWLDFEDLATAVQRVLEPGGVFYFSAFGPDTLYEVNAAWAATDTFPHVHPFPDMHHLGDTLVATGFTNPIVDADWITIDYPDVDVLLQDLKLEGFTNCHPERRKTLTGRHRFQRFRDAMNEKFVQDGELKTTWEFIYGFARAPETSNGSIRVTPPSMKSMSSMDDME